MKLYGYNGIITEFKDLVNLAISKNIYAVRKKDKIVFWYYLNMPNDIYYKISQMQYIKSCDNISDITEDCQKRIFIEEHIKKLISEMPFNKLINERLRRERHDEKTDYEYYLLLIKATNKKIFVTF